MNDRGTVYLVDDEPDLQCALRQLLRAEGDGVLAFQSTQEFLSANDPRQPGCIVIDLRLAPRLGPVVLVNKQIAADLGITEKTVKVHRARAMQKMGVSTLADLVRKTLELELGAVIHAGPANGGAYRP